MGNLKKGDYDDEAVFELARLEADHDGKNINIYLASKTGEWSIDEIK